MNRTDLYILYRRIKAFGNAICFHICRIFPIDRHLISVCTFEGKGGFGCNPKYLVQEIHRENPDIRFVWLVNEVGKHSFPEYIKEVPNTLWSRAYWLSRSKIWIDNYRKPYGTCKRSGQYYLNVNHFTMCIKCTGLWRGSEFSRMAYLVNSNDSSMIDDLVIDSDWCQEVSPKGMVYGGTYLKTGAPRCDALYGDRSWAKQKFREQHHLPDNAKIVMFAPTFREGAHDGKRFVFSETWSIDFKRLLRNLEKRFGGEWYLCVRVHPQLAPGHEDFQDSSLAERVIDESRADDFYEIFAGMDAYITDYSSAVFEAGYAHIPAFIYADDITQYQQSRGSLMWDFNLSDLSNVTNNRTMTPSFQMTLPFSVSQNNDDLEKNILQFDQLEYDNKLNRFHQQAGVVFDGKASEKLTKIVQMKMK